MQSTPKQIIYSTYIRFLISFDKRLLDRRIFPFFFRVIKIKKCNHIIALDNNGEIKSVLSGEKKNKNEPIESNYEKYNPRVFKCVT